jgi:hypothetical protein
LGTAIYGKGSIDEAVFDPKELKVMAFLQNILWQIPQE